jgi:hypothetical protein
VRGFPIATGDQATASSSAGGHDLLDVPARDDLLDACLAGRGEVVGVDRRAQQHYSSVRDLGPQCPCEGDHLLQRHVAADDDQPLCWISEHRHCRVREAVDGAYRRAERRD